jgi:hypothetical protein
MNSGGGGMGVDDEELVVANVDRVGRKRNCIGEIWWQFLARFWSRLMGMVVYTPIGSNSLYNVSKGHGHECERGDS